MKNELNQGSVGNLFAIEWPVVCPFKKTLEEEERQMLSQKIQHGIIPLLEALPTIWKPTYLRKEFKRWK